MKNEQLSDKDIKEITETHFGKFIEQSNAKVLSQFFGACAEDFNEEREGLINQITLIDTSDYRCRTTPLQHEPLRFRANLSEIYRTLSTAELKKLLALKEYYPL